MADISWDIKYKTGDIIIEPCGWAYYMDDVDAVNLDSHLIVPPLKERRTLRKHCDKGTYKLMCNVFDFPDSENIKAVLLSDDSDGIKFIFEHLKTLVHENEKR